MKCNYCGKEFKRTTGNQKFCSITCRKYSYRISTASQKPKPIIHKICIECGKSFTASRSTAEYCSSACKNEKYKVKGNKNRKFTELTPYLCQKWHREGMSIRLIAELLNRSIQNIKIALAVPLTNDAYADIRKFAR